MKLTAPEIKTLASETSEQEYNNLFNRFTNKEENLHNSLVKLGDSKEIALWTVISERYEVKPDVEFLYNAYNN